MRSQVCNFVKDFLDGVQQKLCVHARFEKSAWNMLVARIKTREARSSHKAIKMLKVPCVTLADLCSTACTACQMMSDPMVVAGRWRLRTGSPPGSACSASAGAWKTLFLRLPALRPRTPSKTAWAAAGVDPESL